MTSPITMREVWKKAAGLATGSAILLASTAGYAQNFTFSSNGFHHKIIDGFEFSEKNAHNVRMVMAGRPDSYVVFKKDADSQAWHIVSAQGGHTWNPNVHFSTLGTTYVGLTPAGEKEYRARLEKEIDAAMSAAHTYDSTIHDFVYDLRLNGPQWRVDQKGNAVKGNAAAPARISGATITPRKTPVPKRKPSRVQVVPKTSRLVHSPEHPAVPPAVSKITPAPKLPETKTPTKVPVAPATPSVAGKMPQPATPLPPSSNDHLLQITPPPPPFPAETPATAPLPPAAPAPKKQSEIKQGHKTACPPPEGAGTVTREEFDCMVGRIEKPGTLQGPVSAFPKGNPPQTPPQSTPPQSTPPQSTTPHPSQTTTTTQAPISAQPAAAQSAQSWFARNWAPFAGGLLAILGLGAAAAYYVRRRNLAERQHWASDVAKEKPQRLIAHVRKPEIAPPVPDSEDNAGGSGSGSASRGTSPSSDTNNAAAAMPAAAAALIDVQRAMAQPMRQEVPLRETSKGFMGMNDRGEEIFILNRAHAKSGRLMPFRLEKGKKFVSTAKVEEYRRRYEEFHTAAAEVAARTVGGMNIPEIPAGLLRNPAPESPRYGLH